MLVYCDRASCITITLLSCYRSKHKTDPGHIEPKITYRPDGWSPLPPPASAGMCDKQVANTTKLMKMISKTIKRFIFCVWQSPRGQISWKENDERAGVCVCVAVVGCHTEHTSKFVDLTNSAAKTDCSSHHEISFHLFIWHVCGGTGSNAFTATHAPFRNFALIEFPSAK